ncbi:Alpha/beta knot methyltransferase, partial [Baffinella frigidus]
NADTAAERTARPTHPVHVVLDNLRSAYNVGSIFRTADAAHCAEVVTCGFTPHPPLHPKLSKTGFGAGTSLFKHLYPDLEILFSDRTWKGRGDACRQVSTYHLVPRNEPLRPEIPTNDLPWWQGVALVLGNEEIGVDTKVLAAADGVIEIPCFGAKNSLNVCSAASIVIYEALRQWNSLNNSTLPSE